MKIPISDVYPNPDQPRKRFDEAGLQELAASIKASGLLQQITVRPDHDGRFMIVAGERRWRAHQLAGLATIEANPVAASDDELAIPPSSRTCNGRTSRRSKKRSPFSG